MQTLPVRYLFVYGTLRRGEERDINLLRPRPEALGVGMAHGVLYDLGAYPGMQVGEQGCTSKVHGEIYCVTAELEQLLDQIEEVWPQQTGEYAKREIWVQMDSSSTLNRIQTPSQMSSQLKCLVYAVSTLHAHGKPIISSGDWVSYRTQKAQPHL